jgi:hypothetical protein
MIIGKSETFPLRIDPVGPIWIPALHKRSAGFRMMPARGVEVVVHCAEVRGRELRIFRQLSSLIHAM